MAEVKEKKIVKAAEDGERKIQAAAPTGNAGSKRAVAIVLWVLAIVCELISILMLFGKVSITFAPTMYIIIGLLVLDLILVIVGSQFWKKANHIDPASKKNKVKFFLWNNMGVIVCVFAFLPYLILLLANKDKLDAKTRKVAIIAAIAALAIGSAASFDYNPVSEEEKAAAEAAISAEVFWSPFGHVYHTSSECQALNQSDTLTQGSVEQAIAANRTRLCSFCAKRDSIEGVATDGKEVTAEEVETTLAAE